jgi:hypothetical protein
MDAITAELYESGKAMDVFALTITRTRSVELGSGQAPIWDGAPPATQFDRFDPGLWRADATLRRG